MDATNKKELEDAVNDERIIRLRIIYLKWGGIKTQIIVDYAPDRESTNQIRPRHLIIQFCGAKSTM